MPRRESVRDWLVVLLLTSAMIFSFIDRFTLSLLIEPIKRDLAIGDAEIGLLNGVAFGLFYAAMGLPLGWLADRWSRKGTIVLGVGIWTVATAACGFASTFGQLLAARIGVGAGEAGLAPASYGIIHDRFPPARLARAMSVFQVGSMVGSGTALLVAGALYRFFLAGGGIDWPIIGALAPWQQTFIAVAAPGIIFVALLALIAEPRRDGAEHSPAATRGAMMAALRAAPARYALLFAGMSGPILTTYAMLSWFPAILERELGWAPHQIGATYGIVVLVAAPLGLLAGGFATDLLVARGVRGVHAMLAMGSALAALPFAVALAFGHQPVVLLAMAAALHFLLSVPIGIIPAYIQVTTPAAARGQVSALYVLAVNLAGLGIGPAVIGYISSLTPDQADALRHAVVIVVVPALVAGSGLLGRLAARERRGPIVG